MADRDIFVENIIIEPNSLSQQFMVYGVFAASAEGDEEIVKDSQAFLTYMDFSSLHQRQCKGADIAGDSSSDFELWTPYDGRHGDANKCWLGQ